MYPKLHLLGSMRKIILPLFIILSHNRELIKAGNTCNFPEAKTETIRDLARYLLTANQHTIVVLCPTAPI